MVDQTANSFPKRLTSSVVAQRVRLITLITEVAKDSVFDPLAISCARIV